MFLPPFEEDFSYLPSTAAKGKYEEKREQLLCLN